MTRYVIIAVVSGVLFGVMDRVINANPLAQRLFEVYKPIGRTSINALAGIVIDLVYGFAMAGLFLLLYHSLPGTNGLAKGLAFGGIAWFFRVAMSVASTWIMYTVPAGTLAYVAVTGLAEMAVLGMLYGLTLSRAGVA